MLKNLEPCDLCGKRSKLTEAIVEGTIVSVCNNCLSFGNPITLEHKKEPETKIQRKIKIENAEEIILPNYMQLIKEAREKLELTQKELAKKIAEKESLIHQLESGHLKPTIDFAKKLEKSLDIKIIEVYKEPEKRVVNLSDPGLTIGDLLKLKKK